MQPVLLVALLLGGTEPSTITEDPAATATAAAVNQHIAVSVLSAMHYCENSSWLEGVADVQTFYEISSFPLPVQVDWEMLKGQKSSYSVDHDTLTLVTAAGAIAEALRVTSTNEPPGCDGSNIDVNTKLDVGE